MALELSGGTLQRLGRRVVSLGSTVHRLLAFFLIALGSLATPRPARRLMAPLIMQQVYRWGWRFLPVISFVAIALGLLVVGQTVLLMNRVGARDYIGLVMVTVVIRELGPLLTAMLVLMRSGTGTVIELGTSRALGEVEALEALGIDPIHYLVVPRLVGMALSTLALTIYLVLGTLFSGYLFVFLQDVRLLPGEYFRQIADALTWMDFVLLGAKAVCFGLLSTMITSYHGLARPMRMEEISSATVSALAQSMVAFVLLDSLFLMVYLIL